MPCLASLIWHQHLPTSLLAAPCPAQVACGVVMIGFGRAFISPRAQPFCRHWWHWADWTAK